MTLKTPTTDSAQIGNNAMWLFERDPSGALSAEQLALMEADLALGAIGRRRMCALADLPSVLAEYPDRPVIPVGGTDFVLATATYLGLEAALRASWPGSYPAALYPFLHRTVETMTRADAIAFAGTRDLFVKPAGLPAIKAFTGQIIGPGRTPDEEWARQPEDLLVYGATPVTWQSEYRVYINKGRIMGRTRYDLRDTEDVSLPDNGVVAEMVAAFTDAPAGYALDVGILDTGETALVEVNDGWALGYYKGFSPLWYRNLLAARWQELQGE